MNKKMPKLEVVFDFRHSSTHNKPGTVHVRVNGGRNDRRYVNTGVRVLPHEWSDTYWVVARDDAEQLNNMIREQLDACRDAIRQDNDATTEQMKVDRSDASFIDWLDEQIDAAGLEPGTIKHHRTVYASIVAYGKMRKWHDVTRENIEQWLRWVGTRSVKKVVDGRVESERISQVTLYGYWKRLKKWLRVAIERRLLPSSVLLGIKVEKGKSGDREFLTDEEIERWKNVQLPYPYLCDARDRFLVQIGSGLAYSDLMEYDFSRHIRYGEHETLQGRRRKTNEQYFLVLLPVAVDVLERWEWKVPRITNQKYNQYLHEVAMMAGIDKRVTSHVARHTYATLCLSHGVRLEAVQRTLGHSSIKTTQIYAKMVDRDVLEAFDKMK